MTALPSILWGDERPFRQRVEVSVDLLADALQPVADLLSLQLFLEIVGRTLGNQLMSLNSHGQSY